MCKELSFLHAYSMCEQTLDGKAQTYPREPRSQMQDQHSNQSMPLLQTFTETTLSLQRLMVHSMHYMVSVVSSCCTAADTQRLLVHHMRWCLLPAPASLLLT